MAIWIGLGPVWLRFDDVLACLKVRHGHHGEISGLEASGRAAGSAPDRSLMAFHAAKDAVQACGGRVVKDEAVSHPSLVFLSTVA